MRGSSQRQQPHKRYREAAPIRECFNHVSARPGNPCTLPMAGKSAALLGGYGNWGLPSKFGAPSKAASYSASRSSMMFIELFCGGPASRHCVVTRRFAGTVLSSPGSPVHQPRLRRHDTMWRVSMIGAVLAQRPANRPPTHLAPDTRWSRADAIGTCCCVIDSDVRLGAEETQRNIPRPGIG